MLVGKLEATNFAKLHHKPVHLQASVISFLAVGGIKAASILPKALYHLKVDCCVAEALTARSAGEVGVVSERASTDR